MQPNGKTEQWREIFGDWDASGQTQREYCQQRKISLSGFQYWRRRLAEDAGRTIGHGIQAVEVGRIQIAPWPTLSMELDAQNINFPVFGSDAKVTITGRINLDRLGRIMTACSAENNEGVKHAQA